MKLESLLLLVAAVIISACNKYPEERLTRIEAVSEITYNSAEVITNNDVLKGDNLDGGLCWSTMPDPTEGDYFQEGSNYDWGSSLNDDYFILEDLIANTDYYLRSMMKTEQGILYSENYKFTTKNIPSAPCTIAEGTMDFGTFVENMTNLQFVGENAYGTSDFGFEATCDYGKIRLFFKRYPVSGVYRSVVFGGVEDNWDIGLDFRGGVSNSYYNNGENDQIYVEVIDDVVTVKFCDVVVVSLTGLGPDSHSLSGSLIYK